jgi:hypothetical protein
MARQCLNKKRQPFRPQNCQSSDFQQKPKFERKPGFKPNPNRFKPQQSYAKATIEEVDDNADLIPFDNNNDDLDIPNIAAHTTRFSDKQKKEWI